MEVSRLLGVKCHQLCRNTPSFGQCTRVRAYVIDLPLLCGVISWSTVIERRQLPARRESMQLSFPTRPPPELFQILREEGLDLGVHLDAVFHVDQAGTHLAEREHFVREIIFLDP